MMVETPLKLTTRLSFVLGVEPSIAQRISNRQTTFADLQAAQAASRFSMDRVLQFCLHPERVEAERLNPNTLTPAQIQHLPGILPDRWPIVAESRPFFSFDELEQATRLPKARLREIFALPAYCWPDKPQNAEIAVSPVPGVYTAIAESAQFAPIPLGQIPDFEAAPVVAMATGQVVVLQAQSATPQGANPHPLKQALTGRICPAVQDASGAVRYLVPLSLDLWFKPGTPRARMAAILAELGLAWAADQGQGLTAMGYVRAVIPGCPIDTDSLGATLERVTQAAQYDEVQFAEPEQIGLDDFAPISLQSTRASDFEAAGRDWNYQSIHLAAAHQLTEGQPQVTIFVIDGGLDTTHPALAAALRPDWPEVDLNFTLEQPASALSPHEMAVTHGTHVASVVAAQGHASPSPGVLARGVAPGCRVLPIKISGSMGYGLRAAAIRQAIRLLKPGQRGVINLSWRTQGEHIGIREALVEADRQGFAIVTSAGNYLPGEPQQADALHFPSAHRHRYPYLTSLCVVGATTVDGKRASYSYFGPTSVTVAAPGGEVGQAGKAIYTASPGGDYAYVWGTSFAAPHGAGVLALMLSANPELTAAAAIDILQTTAQPLAPDEPSALGHGLIDAQRALAAVPATVVGEDSSPEDSSPQDSSPDGQPLASPGKVNLNAASPEELATVPLMTPWRIQQLLAYRTHHGPLLSLWDLLQTGAFNLWVIRQLFDYVVV
jgi:DNA uptake protein ComE-like DNA-binding protein